MKLITVIANSKAKGLKPGQEYLATPESAKILQERGWIGPEPEPEKPKRGRKPKTAE